METEGPVTGSRPGGWEAATRLGELNLLLLAFYLEMRRGMEEFRRVYGLTGPEAEISSISPEVLAERLFGSREGKEALRELESGIQELKIHHAALLEGYHQATHEGARNLLSTLDPERLREEFEGAKVQIGPLRVSCRWQPLLVQTIWEEMLRRFHEYGSCDPADFDRFYQDGFRNGYRRFWEKQAPSRHPSAGRWGVGCPHE